MVNWNPLQAKRGLKKKYKVDVVHGMINIDFQVLKGDHVKTYWTDKYEFNKCCSKYQMNYVC